MQVENFAALDRGKVAGERTIMPWPGLTSLSGKEVEIAQRLAELGPFDSLDHTRIKRNCFVDLTFSAF